MAQLREPATHVNEYIAISVSMLSASKLCGVSLYVRENAAAPMRLFRGAEYPITQELLDELIASGRRKLYVACNEHRAFQQYLREHLDESLSDESLAVAQRFDMLNVVVRDLLGESFQRGNVDETVATTNELSQHVVDLLSRDDAVASELCGVLYHDYHTFTHSANVAYYSVMLSKALGISDEGELKQIATGALLHDLGKLEIPAAILTKPGRLTDDECEIVKEHPTIGFRSLCKRDDLTRGQLMMVYQHHERTGGGGYPVGCAANEIHDWARTCTVSDVFEALTSNRPYRAGMNQEKAFEIMDRSAETRFDKGVYQCWKRLIMNG